MRETLIPLAGLIIGAGLGALIGARNKGCGSSACVLMSNPWIASIYWGILGLMLALSSVAD